MSENLATTRYRNPKEDHYLISNHNESLKSLYMLSHVTKQENILKLKKTIER
jgi:hypothetical protein